MKVEQHKFQVTDIDTSNLEITYLEKLLFLCSFHSNFFLYGEARTYTFQVSFNIRSSTQIVTKETIQAITQETK